MGGRGIRIFFQVMMEIGVMREIIAEIVPLDTVCPSGFRCMDVIFYHIHLNQPPDDHSGDYLEDYWPFDRHLANCNLCTSLLDHLRKTQKKMTAEQRKMRQDAIIQRLAQIKQAKRNLAEMRRALEDEKEDLRQELARLLNEPIEVEREALPTLADVRADVRGQKPPDAPEEAEGGKT